MLGNIFYWVLNMSITAAITGCAVLLFRKLPRIPKRIASLAWVIPFFRMAIPVGLTSKYSFMTLFSRYITEVVTVPVPGSSFVHMANHVQQAETYFPFSYKVNLLEQVFQTAGVVWLIGAAAILLTLGVLYITTLREIRGAAHVQGHVYESEKVTAPAVYGIFRPRIVLPAGCKDAELVILHERTHIRRGDNLWRVLAFGIAAVHWFNPLGWVFLRLCLTDMELACDECVLGVLGADRAKAYAHALLDASAQRSVFISAFGGAKIRTRIENILSYRKLTALSLAGFAALLAAVAFTLLTNGG